MHKLARSLRRLSLVLLLMALPLAACSGTRNGGEQVEKPAEELWAEATRLLDEERFEQAAKAFEEVERQHPYSQLATRAQLMAAYAYYEGGMYDAAIAAAERFIELHPGHEEVPYAHYLVAVSWYEQISDVGRDQGATEKALEALNLVVQRFPDSDYARDAQYKIDLVRDHLAGKEMEIGRFYQRQGRWLAAMNRFRRVVEAYQTTTHVPEALHRLVECNLALGLEEEARVAAAVLGHNFPDSEWYRRSYALLQGRGLEPEPEKAGWLSRLANLWPF
ncbi:Outer membrane protein assembly factor BamD [bacterium HR40]|nr:Outer membrane protein assembly factor BamD [bacterium HR40]